MDINRAEIINALIIIRDICKGYGSCADCPFWDGNGSCNIGTYPENWDINIDFELWRAFK